MKTLTSLLLILALCVGVNHTLDAQQGRLIPGQTPCDLVSSGCAAAHSVNRRIVKAYTGHLFQLSRTGGGGGTQNIDALATGLVDTGTVGTFCGAGSTGPNANGGANSCAYHIIYDQSGNANNLTAVGTDTPYATDASSRPKIPINSAVTGYYNNAAPTSLPTGAVDQAVLVVMDDTTRTVCCGWYGQCHSITDADTPGTCFVLGLRGPNGGIGSVNANSVDADFEEDVAEQTYIPNYSANSLGGTFNGLGITVGIGSYNHTTKLVTLQVNNQASTSVTYSTGLSSPVHPNLRFGAGGDASPLAGIFYEGLIMAKDITQADRTQLANNEMNFYQLARQPACSNAGRQLTPTEILGASNVVIAAGLRVLNVAYQGPLAQIQRASDSTTKDIFAVGCDFDTATATTFCTATTCLVSALYNQLSGQIAQTEYSSNGWANNFDWLSTVQDGSGNVGAALTFSCLGSFPCMGFPTTQTLQAVSGVNLTPPLSIFVASDRTSGIANGGMVVGSSAATPFLGYAQVANTAYYQSAGFPNNITQTASDSSFHSIAGVTTDSTHISIYVDGTAANSGSTTTFSSTITGLLLGGKGTQQFVGNVFEIVTSNGVISPTNISTLSAAAKAYWGY